MKFSVAPMLDWTDKHCRYFYRLLSNEATLYTEMITTKAIIFGNKERLLGFDDKNNKTVLQLGGSDPKEMLECCIIAQDFGYKEININVGCPSERVQSGNFGASLMLTPEIVAENVAKMRESGLKITVKNRIGVDDMDGYAGLLNFIKTVKSAGCDDFIIHARKALLKGISPKDNRTIPPLNYDFVYQIKQEFPELNVSVNGGIKTFDECKNHLQNVDGVMLGREVYHNPYILSKVDSEFYGVLNKKISREEVLEKLIIYIQEQNKKNIRTRSITRHLLGLYHSQPNSKKFKRELSGKIVEITNIQNFLKSP
jgi:tRNA-dihydrouridine synthase A